MIRPYLVVRRHFVCIIVGLSTAIIATPNTSRAAEFPDHAIKLVVPFPPGGGTDTLARQIARRMETRLKQPVVVENVVGALGTIGASAVARAPADGYTLLLGISGTNAIAPSLYPKLTYNAINDFTPVAQLATLGNVLVVNPAIPVHTVKELVAWSAKQSAPAYGSWGIGSGGHLAMEMIKAKTGMQMTHVPYKGALAAMNDVIAGQIPVAMTDSTSAGAFVKAGKARAIAVTGSTRASNMPEVPTLAEQGIPFDTDSWYALFAPSKVPPSTLGLLRATVAAVMAEPELPKLLADLGLNPSKLSPEAFAEVQKKEIGVWASLVKLSGATAE